MTRSTSPVLSPEVLDALAATRRPFERACTLPRSVYVDREVFALEQRTLFARTWLCVAREEDLPEAGSYLTQAVGAERVLVVRGEDGALRAFFNVCRHRGARLVDEPCGTFLRTLSCPYHGWTYALDGRLVAAPRADPAFRAADYPLAQAPLAVRDGFVFVSLDPQAPALAANWKVIAENYGECYHCPLVHPQLHRISDITSGFSRSGACFNGGPMRLREGFATMSQSGQAVFPAIEGLPEDDRRLAHYYLVYPHLMLGLMPDYALVHVAWPLAPDRTRVACDWLFPPATMTAPGFDPADVVDFWDLTNRQDWALCERVQQGAGSRGYAPGPYHAAERCVHAFDAWYAGAIAGAAAPRGVPGIVPSAEP